LREATAHEEPMPRALLHHASLHMLASLAVAVVVSAAVAADAPTSPKAAPELDGPADLPNPGTGGSIQSGMPGCAVWTDRCVICQRDGGVVACSNIGIACQPQAMLCLRNEAAEEKKPPN
jgi:hypothetical protein